MLTRMKAVIFLYMFTRLKAGIFHSHISLNVISDEAVIFLCHISLNFISGEIIEYERPHLTWSSPNTDTVFAGQTKRMKCLFSGL